MSAAAERAGLGRVRVSECSLQKPLDSSLGCGAEGAPQGASFRMTIVRDGGGSKSRTAPFTAKGAAPAENPQRDPSLRSG